MDQGLKERLVGAAVLVAIAVWLIPWVLDGPEAPLETTGSSLQLPAAEEPMPMRTQTLRLGRRRGADRRARPDCGAARDRNGGGRRRKRRPRPNRRPVPAPPATKRKPSPRHAPSPSAPHRRQRSRRRRPPATAAETRTGRSERRLDGAARQLQRGSQRAAHRAASRHVRLQGRGLELQERRADAVSSARRPADDACRGRRRGVGVACSRHQRRPRGRRTLSR